MKLFFALILITTASSATAAGTSRPGANNGSLIEQPAQKPVANQNQMQEEQDFRTDEQIRLDQVRREKANARRLKEERLRRQQRSNTQATIVP